MRHGALVLLNAGALLAAVALTALAPSGGAWAFYAPRGDAAAVAARAGLPLVSVSADGRTAVVAGADLRLAPALLAAGAALLFNPNGAVGCGSRVTP